VKYSTDYTPFGGGLDYVTSALSVPPGRLAECRNFEELFGKQGYKRMDGYERFDGRPAPSDAATEEDADTRRAAIQKVPGEGEVLGVAVYEGDVYAVRNIAGGASATLWKSTPSGWTSIRTGLYPGGKWKFDVANFSAAATDVALFGVNGRSRMIRYNGVAVTFADAVYGSEATSVTSNTIGTGSKTFVVAQPTRSWEPNDVLTIWSSADAGNRMVGTVTSYTPGTNTLVINITSVVGSGTFTLWEMGLASFEDKPYDLLAHKDHMFWAYPNGQLQTSNLGNPMQATTSAALFGLGDFITGLTSLKGGVIAVFCRNKVDLISGTSVADWVKEQHATNTGARTGTVQENAGNTFFLDERGITTLQSTLSFGSFEAAIFSRTVTPYLDAAAPNVIGSRMQRSKYQYKLYFNNKEVLTGAILSPNAVLQPNDVSFTRQLLDHQPVCFGSGDLADGTLAYFFGTDNGWVMREDKGPSFDGELIEAVMRFHFNQYKTPSNRKRFHKLVLELEAEQNTDISFKQLFDFADGFYPKSVNQSASALAAMPPFDIAEWDKFFWSHPTDSQAEVNVDGIGRNMSLIFYNKSASAPFVLQGVLTHYNVLGVTR